MSLYWQQAVQNRGTAPAHGAQGHNQGHVDPQSQWQNVNLGTSSAATNTWSQVPVNQPVPQAHYQNAAHSQQYATTNQGYVDYHGQSYSVATSSNSNVSIQHTPLLKAPENQASVQEHPKVDLSPEPSENKPSQVTPESTYSVDTFSSLTKEQEKNQEDDWDDWEQTPKEEHEKSPHDVGSTVSEPVLMLHSDRSREISVASGYEQQNGYDFYNHEPERSSEVQPVAQVAPLLKNPISESFEQPVARVGPVYQAAADHASNVGRVAPTRSVHTSSRQLVESSNEHQRNERVEPAPSSVPSQPVAQVAVPTISENTNEAPTANNGPAPQKAENNIVDPESAVEHPNPAAEALILSVPQPNVDRVTPDNTPSMNEDSPGEAQATSTPLTAEQKEEDRPERRSSVSSIRGSGVVPPKPPSIANGEHSDSTQGSIAFTRGGTRASYQERYKSVKEQYIDSRNKASQSIHRLERMRTDTPKMNKINPLADLNVSGRRSILQISARSANKADPSNSSFADKTVYSHADASLDQSIDIGGNNSVGYGDDFVDASRRSRLNRSRPVSRAKSDVGGDDVPFHRGHHGHRNRHMEMGYSGQHQYYGYHPSMGRHHGRVSVAGMPYQPEYYQQQQAIMYHNQRPQSTYDHRSMERFQRAGGNMNMSYDAYDHHGPVDDDLDESISDESEIDDEQGESEDEMRTYNMHRGAVNNSFSSYSMTGHQRRHISHYGPDEIYHFGIIRLEVSAVDAVFRHMPPPQEFYTCLNSREKAAYLYFACIYSKLFPQGVVAFGNMFRREFFKHVCEGNTENNALIKVCKSMYDEFMLKRQNSQQRAYEASQRQLFSDDRDSADGLSDRASVYDHREDDRASDILSVDNSHRAPLKFRTPHAFMKFGPGGMRITMHPDKSVSVMNIDDVRSILRDNHSRRIIDAAHNFKGPLIPGSTAPHSIRLYIQNQIVRIRSSEVAMENPSNADVVDCLLLWQLLETVVQQQGRVTGPDIARLLISAGASTSKRVHQNHREKSATPSTESTRSNPLVDPKAFDRFTQFLLGGHVDEAVECAVRDGLYADAMVLVRRIYGSDLRKLADIEAKFLATRPSSNPVMTLVSVASGLPAPVLSNPPIDDTGSWRSHAAIVLANLNTAHALETVYHLGRVLAKREYHAAADFCFLAVALLSNFQGINVFQPVPKTEQEGNERCHVTLIHASLPDDEWDSTNCRFGFSLTDLHATEIFDFAVRLQYTNQPSFSPLQNSVEYQQRRLQYAQLLASYGGFNSEAFRYLLSVASSIWNYASAFRPAELIQLADLAESLRSFADEDPTTNHSWIQDLRSMAFHLAQNPVTLTPQEVQQPSVEQPTATNANQEVSVNNDQMQYNQQQQAPAHHVEEEFNPIASRSRSESLAVEAHDWHADRQDPIQMSPRSSVATPPPVQITSPPVESYQTPRGRADSHSSQNSRMGYGEQLCHTQHQQYHQAAVASYNQGNDEESTPNDSTTEASHESTPVRQRTTSSSASAATTEVWRPTSAAQMTYAPEPAYQNYQTPAPQNPTPAAPPSQLQSASAPSAAAPASQKSSQPQVNGLKKGGSNNSSGLISWVRQRIPGNKEMKLPDDTQPTIRWDENLQKWVGDGVEEETVAAPPPKMDMGTAPPPAPSGPTGLRAARGGGGSRYFNPLAGANNTNSAPIPAPIAPPTMPMSFNFIPTMPDDSETVDPFSGVADPIVHGAEQSVASS